MANTKAKCRGLFSDNINEKEKFVIDPDNVFWGIVKKDQNSHPFLPRDLISLYEKMKRKCDREIEHFRFDSELTAIYINPTEKCNAHCPYCYVPAKIRTQGRSMTEEELHLILSKIAGYFKGRKRQAVIVFHASEPLLVKEIIFKAIERFKNNFYFGIQTNALLLDEDDITFIKKHKISIGISLDAADAKTNNRLRYSAGNGGNFKKAVQAIEWFKGYKGLNVITTITRFNVTKLPALVRFLNKKGVGCVLMNPVRLTQKNSHFLKPDDKVMTKYFIKAIEESLKSSMNYKHKIIIGNFANTLLAIIAPAARRLMCDISPCGGGRCFLTITASGEMIPCGEFIGLKNSSGGNIFKNSIGYAMQSEAFKQIRSRFVEKISECDDCLLRNICGAPCPAELQALGDMYKKSVFCKFYQEIIKYAFKLIAEGKEKHFLRKEALKNLKYEYLL